MTVITAPRGLGPTWLALRQIEGSAFRSWVVFLCAALMAGFSVAATLMLQGAQDSLRLALERLGADIIVVPSGTRARVEHAFLMGVPAICWMPAENLEKIAALPGVAAASPQIYLATLRGASCCTLPEMFLVAYDPPTDFTLRPWLDAHLHGGLKLGEAIGGSLVFVPEGQDEIYVYGYAMDLKGNLAATGTGIDQTMFLTFETARDIARLSPIQAEKVLEIPEDSISTVLVKVALDADTRTVAASIRAALPGVDAIESANLFSSQRQGIISLLRTVAVLLAAIWLLALVLVGLVFSLSVNERRRETGVLRALGSSRAFLLRSLLVEAALLALSGGTFGIALFTFTVFLFHNLLVRSLGLPFLIPSGRAFLSLAPGGLLICLISVVLAALPPAWRASCLEPATAMRE
ncbi:MAG: ABC transporter permease [Anaerolineae bacterium]